MSRRHCPATTKRGKPCKATPRRDTGRCNAHSDKKTRESMGFGGSQARAGRPVLPKPTEVARRLVEENVAAILRPHFKALGLLLSDDGSVTPLERGAVITGESKDGDVIASTVEDLGAQIAAAEKLLDRVYGRPKVTTEISGPDGGPAAIVPVSRDRAGEVLGLLAAAGIAVHGGEQS